MHHPKVTFRAFHQDQFFLSHYFSPFMRLNLSQQPMAARKGGLSYSIKTLPSLMDYLKLKTSSLRRTNRDTTARAGQPLTCRCELLVAPSNGHSHVFSYILLRVMSDIE